MSLLLWGQQKHCSKSVAFRQPFSYISQGSPSSYPDMEKGCDGSRDTGWSSPMVSLAEYKQLAMLFLLGKKGTYSKSVSLLCTALHHPVLTHCWFKIDFHLLKSGSSCRYILQMYFLKMNKTLYSSVPVVCN